MGEVIHLPRYTKFKLQLFEVSDGALFEWKGERYRLLDCDEWYTATAQHISSGRVEKFNGCVIVEELVCTL